MRGLLFITLSWMILVQCSSSKYASNNNRSGSYDVVMVELAVEKLDTIYSEELQFYKVDAAIDAPALMYTEYGKWHKMVNGKYQNNIPRYVWENVEIDLKRYTIITDGAENGDEFFTAFMIFDQEGNNCMKKGYSDRSMLIRYSENKLKSLDAPDEVYLML